MSLPQSFKISHNLLLCTILLFGIGISPSWSQSPEGIQSQIDQMNQRIDRLEEKLQEQQHQFNEVSKTLQASFDQYIHELEKNLNDFNERLQLSLNERVLNNTFRIAILNPISKEYKRIDTNSGTFFLVIDKIERTPEGYKLKISIGNPNTADFKGVELQLRWGNKRDPNTWKTYEEWDRSLQGAKFFYNINLPRGTWKQVAVDLSPVKIDQLEYIECSMQVKTIELKTNEEE